MCLSFWTIRFLPGCCLYQSCLPQRQTYRYIKIWVITMYSWRIIFSPSLSSYFNISFLMHTCILRKCSWRKDHIDVNWFCLCNDKGTGLLYNIFSVLYGFEKYLRIWCFSKVQSTEKHSLTLQRCCRVKLAFNQHLQPYLHGRRAYLLQ